MCQRILVRKIAKALNSLTGGLWSRSGTAPASYAPLHQQRASIFGAYLATELTLTACLPKFQRECLIILLVLKRISTRSWIDCKEFKSFNRVGAVRSLHSDPGGIDELSSFLRLVPGNGRRDTQIPRIALIALNSYSLLHLTALDRCDLKYSEGPLGAASFPHLNAATIRLLVISISTNETIENGNQLTRTFHSPRSTSAPGTLHLARLGIATPSSSQARVLSKPILAFVLGQRPTSLLMN